MLFRSKPLEDIDLPKDKTLYIYCRSGNRVIAANEILKPSYPLCTPLSEGFEDLEYFGFEVAFYED